MIQTPRGDIAYHLRLTNPDLYQTLDEGVVVGFFADEGGVATIEPLSNENVSQAVMAGVISRSAYVEAHAPSESDKGWCFYASGRNYCRVIVFTPFGYFYCSKARVS